MERSTKQIGISDHPKAIEQICKRWTICHLNRSGWSFPDSRWQCADTSTCFKRHMTKMKTTKYKVESWSWKNRKKEFNHIRHFPFCFRLGSTKWWEIMQVHLKVWRDKTKEVSCWDATVRPLSCLRSLMQHLPWTLTNGLFTSIYPKSLPMRSCDISLLRTVVLCLLCRIIDV